MRSGFGVGERSRFFDLDLERERDLLSASRVFSLDFGLSLDFDAALSALLLRERALRLLRRSRSLLDDDDDDELELDELELDDREPELCDDELLSDEL